MKQLSVSHAIPQQPVGIKTENAAIIYKIESAGSSKRARPKSMLAATSRMRRENSRTGPALRRFSTASAARDCIEKG